ncbi:MAG: type II toxin-antitoxin system RelE/ParE family toxin [Hyphomicrobiaceae bacterium]|jgi:plasmid stabilization system protein ParE
MRLRYSVEARRQIVEIHSYITARNPRAATRVVERIRAAAELLAEFPYIGRPSREPGTYQWVVRGLPYILVYEIGTPTKDELLILAVFHGAREC